MTTASSQLTQYVEAIRQSGLTIYHPVESENSNLWIPTSKLERLLNVELCGVSLAGLPIRTRSKRVKELVCRALGYPVPTSFRKTQPRFPGQLFDTYVQKSNNLQVWNEDIAPARRYVILRVSPNDIVTRVKVVKGATLAMLDKTGTLTQKYQARLIPGGVATELVAELDTDLLRYVIQTGATARATAHLVNPGRPAELVADMGSGLFKMQAGIDLRSLARPVDLPQIDSLLPILQIFEKLRSLIGYSFPDSGYDQERNRGAALHRLVCECLGYAEYLDDGQFPDVRHQLLEVKLQTSATIDLGLVCPDSEEALDMPKITGQQIRHCDVRYALFYAETDGKMVTITHFFLTTGEKFFTRFPQFQGSVTNKKLQIPLPPDFFDR